MKKQQKHFLIAVLAGVLLYFLLPEANGLTKAGIAMRPCSCQRFICG